MTEDKSDTNTEEIRLNERREKWSCQLASCHGQTAGHSPLWLASCETAVLRSMAKYLKLYTTFHLYSSITSQTHSCLCSFVQQLSHLLLKKINNFQRTNTVVFVLWQNDWLRNPVAGKKELLTSFRTLNQSVLLT